MNGSSFLGQDELDRIGFAALGKNPQISRYATFYSSSQISIGDNCRIDDFCRVSGRVSLGRNVHIGTHCSISASDSYIQLGDFAGLSSGCHLIASSDDYSGEWLTNPTVPQEFVAITRGPIQLGRHVILGAASVVLPSVSIGDGSSSGAMTLFNRSVEAWGIYVGQPARRLRDRSQRLLELEQSLILREQQEKGNDC